MRDAIRKLEFYGIVKTLPQSGTIVAGLGMTALEGLITDVLKIEETDFASLVETREILEINSAMLAAKHRTADDIILIKNALAAYEKKVNEGKIAVEEDLMFHLKIAEASKNNVLKSLMLIITPDILKSYIKLKVCTDNSILKTVREHHDIVQYIINRDAEGAQKAMKSHLRDVVEFSKIK